MGRLKKDLIVVGDRLLIRPEEGEERTDSGLILPQPAVASDRSSTRVLVSVPESCSKDQIRLSTLRLMSAALKDQDIAKRSEDGADVLSEAEIMALFSKMVKQREDSAKAYEEAGRMELAERERAEQDVIREFLPKPLSEDEVSAAIDQAIKDAGATTIRDMGKVMGLLKSKHSGRMDFGAAGGRVKAALG